MTYLCLKRVSSPLHKELCIPFQAPTYLIIQTVQVGTDVFNACSKWVNMKECGDNPYKDNTMEITLERPHDNVQKELTYMYNMHVELVVDGPHASFGMQPAGLELQ